LTNTAATQTNIDDLCWIDDQAGTPVSASSHLESQNSEALRTIYNTSFAPGLDRLLETRWFSADGYMSLASDRSLRTQFENYVAAISSSSGVAKQEARLVWALLSMCRRRPLPGFAGEFINDKEDTLDGDEVAEKHLDTVEALLTGRKLASNPLAECAAAPANLSSPTLTQQLKTREQNFWLHVGEFVCAADADAIEGVLRKSRKLLDNFENRDVVYSIMLMRHIGEKWHDKLIVEAEDERDSKDWLAAKGFLESEAEGQAMNIVIKRVCSMALRAWRT
jgi:white-opaque regulator 2